VTTESVTKSPEWSYDKCVTGSGQKRGNWMGNCGIKHIAVIPGLVTQLQLMDFSFTYSFQCLYEYTKLMKPNMIWGSHSNEYKVGCLLGCTAV
jgi:hypothetical protein